MIIAILSDLHLDVKPIQISSLFNDGDDEKIDLVVLAGDLHPNIDIRMRFLVDLELYVNAPVFFIPGNHDFYDKGIGINSSSYVGEYEGVSIAGATLWTTLSPSEWFIYHDGLNDCGNIPNWTYDNYVLAHYTQKRFLLNSKANVIVSHHAPTHLSIAEKYKGEKHNCCFANNFFAEIFDMKPQPKLWIHGHTHSEFDYMVGKTRVICHPRGYPHEPEIFNGYKAKLVEVK
jgi:predicted phosphodiesterase